MKPPVTKHERQLKAFAFLRGRGGNGTFKLGELATATGWKESTARTHIVKHYNDWVHGLGEEKFKVLPEFLRVTEEHFIRHCTQVKQVFTQYITRRFDGIVTFELLLPMSRETELRATLDLLFYADALSQRLDELGVTFAEKVLPKGKSESAKAHRDRVMELVASWFGGYSISLVNGRFRAASLRTRSEAVMHQAETGRAYLIDETTASVRFIVPIPASERALSQVGTLDLLKSQGAVNAETDRIREIFFAIFVDEVTRIVNGEDTVWLIEESPRCRVLHAWEKTARRA